MCFSADIQVLYIFFVMYQLSSYGQPPFLHAKESSHPQSLMQFLGLNVVYVKVLIYNPLMKSQR